MMDSAKALRGLHHTSLFWRFLLIGAAVLAPLIAALVQFAGDERKMALKATQERAEVLVAHAVDSQDQVVDEARTTLRFLAGLPEIRSGGAECGTVLKQHVALHRWIARLRLVQPDGTEICRDQEADALVSADLRGVLAKVLQGSSFVLGELIADRETGALSMTAAVPVMRNGAIVGVLTGEMSPSIFEGRSPADIDPDLDVTMLVVDRKGTLIAHDPPMPRFIGLNLQDRPVVQKALEASRSIAEIPDLAGVPRLFVFRTLPGTEAVLAIGLNRAPVIGAIDEALRYRLFLITVIIGGSLLLGMLGVESLILRPLRDLVRAAQALEQADFTSLRLPKKGAGEVRILARAFNRMVEAVADRERELLAAKNIAEEALSRANIASRAKTDFLATMSHEIRTPLNGIIGYTDLLLDGRLSARQRRCADLIQVSASALLTVANDILDFSSIEADRIRLQSEPFSLVALVDNTVSIVSSGAGKKGVPIRLELDPQLPRMVIGDETRLRQILLNLLNNAVKFTREGHIVTRVEHKGRSDAGEIVRISVIDTGIGIALEKHDRLFKRFSQVDPSIRREFGGTGLGLAISKRLIELMGGEIGVQSEEGKGSTFWIELALPQAESESHRALVAPIPVSADPARILVAEDVAINQELVKILLEAAGHRIDIVSNGEEAVAAVQARAYDLVLMDIQMPGMDGITATRRIRALDGHASTVFIVAMTANVLPQQVRSFLDAGIDDHLGKPVKRDDLLRKLDEWLPVRRTAGAPKGGEAQDAAAFDEKSFDDFRSMIGQDQIETWLGRLDDQLCKTFGNAPSDGDWRRLGREAHAIIPQAALLGFSELAERCTALERACLQGRGMTACLDQAREAAQRAREMIARMSAEAPAKSA